MSTFTVDLWTIFCETEQAWVYGWVNTPLTYCPNNPAHIVDLNSPYLYQNGFVSTSQSYTIPVNTSGTINYTYIDFTGTTALQTITLPANSPSTYYTISNTSSVAVGLYANGSTIYSGGVAITSLLANTSITVINNNNGVWLVC